MTLSTRLKLNYMVAKYLWNERQRAKKSQSQVAWKLGLTPRQIVDFEQGTRPIPLYYLAKLAEFYETNFEEMATFIHGIPAEAHRKWHPEEYAQIAYHRLRVQYDRIDLAPNTYPQPPLHDFQVIPLHGNHLTQDYILS